MSTAIDSENVGKRYRLHKAAKTRDFWALREVSFGVEAGEIVGVAGGNGAGKSTLLKLLARVTSPTEGRLVLRGRVGSMLEIGTGFHPELTGRENVFLNGAIMGIPRQEIARRFDEIIEFSGVREFLDEPVKHFSSGMQVRLAFAVASTLDSEILLMDEVLAVGDAEFQRRCMEKVSEIVSTGRTIVFVSHNLDALQHLCPRTLYLAQGRLEFDGPTGRALHEYQRRFAASDDAEVDVRSLPRTTDPNSGLRVERVRLHTESARKAVLRDREPIRVTFEVEVQRPQTEVAFEFWVETMDRVRLLYGRSSHVGVIAHVLPMGRFEVTGGIEDHRLAPGRYRLGVGARDARGGLDWVFNVLEFEIEDRPSAGGQPFEPYVNARVRSMSNWQGPRRL